MVIPKKKKSSHIFLSVSLLFSFAIFYLFLQSPGISGGDSGDLVSAAFLRGVPHPPGYPLYTFFGWLLTRIPFGPTPAFRVGLLSSLPASLSIFLMFQIALRLTRKITIALLAAFSLAFNYLFWLHAEIQEVFSLHLFFLFLTALFAILWLEKPKPWLIYGWALVSGLEFSHHHTFILILPSLLYLLLLPAKFPKKSFICLKTILICAVLFFIGVSFYLYVPLVADSNSPVNWNQGNNLKSLLGLITRKDYGSFVAYQGKQFSLRSGFLALISFLFILYQEFTPIGILIIFLGFVFLSKQQKNLFYFSLIWFVFTGPFFQVYSGFPSFSWFSLATAERFYLLPYPVFFIWFSLGLLAIVNWIRKISFPYLSLQMKKILPILTFFLLLLYPLFLLWTNFPKNNLRNFYEFDRLAKNILDSCPKNSLYFPFGDMEVFSTSYAYFVQGLRHDLSVFNMYVPLAIYSYDQDNCLQIKYKEKGQSGRDFWLQVRSQIVKKDQVVCSSENLFIDQTFREFPNGALNVYQKKENLDYQSIHEQNIKFWEKIGNLSLNTPFWEDYFAQSIIRFYSSQAEAISQFFFNVEEYEKAQFWIEKASLYQPAEEKILRSEVLIGIKQKQCEQTKVNFEEYLQKFSDSEAWPLLEAIYEKECLGKEEKYRLFEEKIKDQPTSLPSNSSNMTEVN